MRFLRNISIQRKVLWVILVTTLVGVSVVATAFGAFQIFLFKRNFDADLNALGRIIGSQASAHLNFNAADDAKEYLEGILSIKPAIDYAAIETATNKIIFAEYGSSLPLPAGVVLVGGQALLKKGRHKIFVGEIKQDAEEGKVGFLYLFADYKSEFNNHLIAFFLALLGVLVLLGVVMVPLSARLQRVISGPVLALAETAQVIARKRDYSVRVTKMEEDEIGAFTDAFNQMLEQIEKQDLELRVSRQKFETLVHSIEGIVWEADVGNFQFRFVSQQAGAILGYPLKEWEGPGFFLSHLHPDDREQVAAQLRQAVAEQKAFAFEYRVLNGGGNAVWIRNCGNIVLDGSDPVLLRGVMLDVTQEKKAAEELSALHAELIQASRYAGMAEVATGVLHNVGNVLNSVNVSATVVCQSVKRSEVKNFQRLVETLSAQGENLGNFLTSDPRGKMVMEFMVSLGEQLGLEQKLILKELDLLAKNVEHIKDVVSMQQNYAKVSGFIEKLPVAGLIEDAVQINAVAFVKHRVHLQREYTAVPDVAVDKHKVLQILINLLRNAKYAMDESPEPEKRLVLGIDRKDERHVRIRVTDNGVGIPPENLTRIFSHGFTTRKDGHGFGLHSGALAAKEMGGALTAYSDGPGKGATFILELPLAIGKEIYEHNM